MTLFSRNYELLFDKNLKQHLIVQKIMYLVCSTIFMVLFCYVSTKESDVKRNFSRDDCTSLSYYFFYSSFEWINVKESPKIKRLDGDSLENHPDSSCKKVHTVIEPTISTPKPKSVPTKRFGCGIYNPNGIGFQTTKEVNQKQAKYAEFPWMIVIFKLQKGNGKDVIVYRCGGSLIHPQVVLTAAHCVLDKNVSYIVRAGDWNIRTNTERHPHQDRDVMSIETFLESHMQGLYHDIALLFLKSPVVIAEHVNVVCLPPQSTTINDTRCLTVGWGRDLSGGKDQGVLKKVELLIVQRGPCLEALRKTDLGEDFQFHNSLLCAGGGEGRDVDLGDSGGPLVCPISGHADRLVQVGIVSWGKGGDTPGIYVNLAVYRYWIDEQMAKRKFSTLIYEY